ncbi:MAG: lysozyme inhibitor LprI family protein [Candidatus Xenobia bacterium]
MFKYLMILMLVAATPAVAQTQIDLDRAAAKDFKQADADLNATYKKLIARLEPNVRARLERSEADWLQFRDADTDARSEVNRGGTIAPMVALEWKAYLTRTRTDQLKAWLKQMP